MYRYIGNKSQLAEVIANKIRDIIGDTGIVADLMCGTATVSYALRKRGYKVISSDVMTYSRYHAIVQLLMKEAPNFNKLRNELNIDKRLKLEEVYEYIITYLNNLEPIKGYFYKEFSPEGSPKNGCDPRKYFTSENASKIDAIIMQLNKWRDSNLFEANEGELLYHDLIMSINEVANISGTYGYFLAKFSKSSSRKIELKTSKFNSQYSNDHVVLQGYAENISKNITADLCYLDPPYIKRQYAANYHILETAARGDKPIAEGKSGLRPWRDQYSNFCSKRYVRDSFEKIITNMNCNKFLISYSEDGLLPIEDLVNFLSQMGTVKVDEIKYKRFRSNNSNLSKEITEYLIYLEK